MKSDDAGAGDTTSGPTNNERPRIYIRELTPDVLHLCEVAARVRERVARLKSGDETKT